MRLAADESAQRMMQKAHCQLQQPWTKESPFSNNIFSAVGERVLPELHSEPSALHRPLFLLGCKESGVLPAVVKEEAQAADLRADALFMNAALSSPRQDSGVNLFRRVGERGLEHAAFLLSDTRLTPSQNSGAYRPGGFLRDSEL